MDQIQVNIVKPQLVKGNLKCFLCVLIPGILNPKLRGNEKFLTGNTALPDSSTYSLLIKNSPTALPQKKTPSHMQCTVRTAWPPAQSSRLPD